MAKKRVAPMKPECPFTCSKCKAKYKIGDPRWYDNHPKSRGSICHRCIVGFDLDEYVDSAEIMLQEKIDHIVDTLDRLAAALLPAAAVDTPKTAAKAVSKAPEPSSEPEPVEFFFPYKDQPDKGDYVPQCCKRPGTNVSRQFAKELGESIATAGGKCPTCHAEAKSKRAQR